MNTILKMACFTLVLAVFSATPALAKNANSQGNDKGNKSGHSEHGSKGHDDKQTLHYAGINQKDAQRYALQYQVYGYKPLPPGIRKNMARGKPIPPGLAYQRLPQPYLNSLPRYNGYEWRGYGSDLVLVSIVSDVIADVIIDALR